MNFIKGLYKKKKEKTTKGRRVRTKEYLNQFITIFLILSSFFLVIYSTVNYNLINRLEKLPSSFTTSQTVSIYLLVAGIIFLSILGSKWITKIFLRNTVCLYGVYLIISYLLKGTLNVNNPKFKFWDFAKNDFIQTNFLGILVIILGLSYALSWLNRRFSILKYIKFINTDTFNETLFFAGLSTSLFLTDKNFLMILEKTVADFSDLHDYNSYLIYLLGELLLGFCTAYVITLVVKDGTKHLLKREYTLSTVLSLSLLFAFMLNWALQCGVQVDVDLLGYYIFPGAVYFQIGLLTLLFVFIYLLSNRVIVPSFCIILTGVILAYSNMLKQKLRHEPVLVTDLVWLKEPKLLFSFLDKNTTNFIVIFIIIFCILAFLKIRFLPKDKLHLTNKKRFIYLATIFCSFLFVFQVFQHKHKGKILSGIPVVSKLNNFVDINWLGFYTNAAYRSLSFVWMQQLTSQTMERPNDYSEKTIKELVQKYTRRADEINQSRQNSIEDHTIIYVLSESLSNPDRVSGTVLSQNPIPYIDSLKERTTSGLMHSDGYGGGTANMEFQTITGLPFYNYNDTVSVLYSEVFPKMKVRPVISNFYSDEDKFVVHPSGGNNYNRNNIYRTLGFDHRYFLVDSKDRLKDMGYEGVNVSDESVYNKVVELANTPQSQFFSVITMQNHVPWSEANPEELTATNDGLSDEENEQLVNYAKLLQHTDQSTQHFIEELSKIDKNITVVFYGDHLPGLYPESVFEENPESQYLTDYFIWNNKSDTKLDYPKINSSDFIATLFEHDNLKVSPYYALLTDILHNASIDKTKLTKEQQKIADDLKLIQYDISNGNGYLKDMPEFFEIAKEKNKESATKDVPVASSDLRKD